MPNRTQCDATPFTPPVGAPAGAAMPLNWSPFMRLGVADLDDGRQRLVQRLGRLDHCSDRQLHRRLSALHDRLEQLFLAEEALMLRLRLPGAAPHLAQHARVSRLLLQALAALDDAERAPARDFIALLPHWFMHHLSTMDLELSVAAGMLAVAQEA